MQINFARLIKPLKMCFRRANPRKPTSLLLLLLIGATSVYGAEKSDMRGTRYCEMILAHGLTQYAVYDTLGLNECPEAVWSKINRSVVKKATESSSVHLIGPRFWVVDGFKYSHLINPLIKQMDGLTMREAGVLHIRILNLLRASLPYYKHEVTRHITWTYQADKPVYELIDPNGEVFVMQSYSIQKKAQTQNTLTELGTQLKLPKGWTFKTGVINKAETLETINNIAIVVQDSFDNTYQKATHDFLKTDRVSSLQ